MGDKEHICIVGMLVNEKTKQAPEVQKVLSKHGSIILHRSGIPYTECDRGIINLTLKATEEEVRSLQRDLDKIDRLRYQTICLVEDADELAICDR